MHIDEVGQIGQKALEAYERVSKELDVEMHSRQNAEKRIDVLHKGKKEFIELSRTLAKKAQIRESLTIQPKENLSGKKSKITIRNYLGGYYYFTCDEVKIEGNKIYLIEGKHSKTNSLPSLEDIKDGLLKMILFTNFEDMRMDNKKYKPKAVLKLTAKTHIDENCLSSSQKETLKLLREEAKINNFEVILM